MLRTIERAYEAHRSVPKTLYFSPEPSVWALRRKRLRLPLSTDTFRRIDRYEAAISTQSHTSGLTNLGTITTAMLRHEVISMRAEEPIPDHDALLRVLEAGRIPSDIPRSSTPTALEDAINTARNLGYLVPASLITRTALADDEANVFAAAQSLARRRVAPQLLSLASKFIVPDPLIATKTAYFIDQLFIARDMNAKEGIRLLALQIGGIVDDRRDALLAKLGYEVFHAAGPWARIDPQRVIFEFFDLAGIHTLERFAIRAPGRAISEYKCAYCEGPMIRTATGEGIVEHRDRLVHEECHGDAVDFGYPGNVL